MTKCSFCDKEATIQGVVHGPLCEDCYTALRASRSETFDVGRYARPLLAREPVRTVQRTLTLKPRGESPHILEAAPQRIFKPTGMLVFGETSSSTITSLRVGLEEQLCASVPAAVFTLPFVTRPEVLERWLLRDRFVRAFWWLDLHTRACEVGMLISLETTGGHLTEAVLWGLSIES